MHSALCLFCKCYSKKKPDDTPAECNQVLLTLQLFYKLFYLCLLADTVS